MVASTLNNIVADATTEDQNNGNIELISTMFASIASAHVTWNGTVIGFLSIYCSYHNVYFTQVEKMVYTIDTLSNWPLQVLHTKAAK